MLSTGTVTLTVEKLDDVVTFSGFNDVVTFSGFNVVLTFPGFNVVVESGSPVVKFKPGELLVSLVVSEVILRVDSVVLTTSSVVTPDVILTIALVDATAVVTLSVTLLDTVVPYIVAFVESVTYLVTESVVVFKYPVI